MTEMSVAFGAEDGPVDELIPLTELSLADVRRELVCAATEHRDRADELAVQRAVAEQRAIDRDPESYRALKNEGERARFLVLALASDEAYLEFVGLEAEARGDLEAVRAEIAIREDDFALRKLTLREREVQQQADMLAFKNRELDFQIRALEEARSNIERLRTLADIDGDAAGIEAILLADAARNGVRDVG